MAIERCFAEPSVTAIILDPLVGNVRARRFYERLGFRHVEDRWFGADHCAVHRLPRWAPGPGNPVAQLQVRAAGLGEVRALQLAVLRPDGPLPDDRPPPADALHLGAFDGQTVVGAATVLAADWPGPGALDAPAWQLRSMVVRTDWRGAGVGRRVLDHAVEVARAQGAACLWGAGRTGALGFYAASGWDIVGPEWIKPGVGPHRYVVRRIG